MSGSGTGELLDKNCKFPGITDAVEEENPLPRFCVVEDQMPENHHSLTY